MDRQPQKPVSPVQPGPGALSGAGPGLTPQLTIQEPPLISPPEVLKKPSGTSPTPTDRMQSGEAKSGSGPATLASISRPRPTALGTKLSPKPTRITLDHSLWKEIDLIPVNIPGPQSANVLPHSPTESTLPAHSPQSPHSPQTYLSPSLPQPSPIPPSSLSPKSSLSPQQRTPSPGGSTQSQAQSDKPEGENNDFRVHIVTWNVGSAVPPDDITSLFGPNVSDGNIDMFIIGLQEVNSMINKRLKDALFSDQWSELCMDTLSPFGYVLVASQRMQGVLLLVFSKFCHLPFLRGVQTESTRTGLGGYWVRAAHQSG